MAGGTLNLTAQGINITSENWGVDSQGHMWCNSINAFKITGGAIEQFNNALWDSETMKKINRIIEIFDSRIESVEETIKNPTLVIYEKESHSVSPSANVTDYIGFTGEWSAVTPGVIYDRKTVNPDSRLEPIPRGTCELKTFGRYKKAIVELGVYTDNVYQDKREARLKVSGLINGSYYDGWEENDGITGVYTVTTPGRINGECNVNISDDNGGAYTWVSAGIWVKKVTLSI